MRSSARRSSRKAWIYFVSTLCLISSAFAVLRHVLHGPAYGLPYADQFKEGRGEGWTAYGGTWQIADGAMQNVSDERGAKLLNGSVYWTDYVIDADLRLDGESGDAGLLLRVQEPEEGVDAFRGFYAGLRLRDNALIGGDADYGWLEQAPRPLSSKLMPYQWYHLRASVMECRLQALASTTSGTPLALLEFSIPSCSEHGQIGLRSYASGGSWKNVRVTQLKKTSRESNR